MNGLVLKGSASHHPLSRAIKALAMDAWSWLLHCRARARQRQSLAELDRRLLQDIGVSEARRMMEVEKPFWR